jgi:ATP-dependent Clp protease adaptor protein ClpS
MGGRDLDPHMPKRRPQEESDTEVVTEEQIRTEKPRLWKVILHNDDYTTMEFVIRVLQEVFNKGEPEAVELTMQVHTRGMCLAGVYTHEIAETKVQRVQDMADAAEFPFLSTMEPE